MAEVILALHLQHLPPGTPTAAVYLILGQLPATAVLARNILTLYVSMIRNRASVECQIIERQLAVKDSKLQVMDNNSKHPTPTIQPTDSI